ncbi:YibE/F family protein [Actinomadura rudentiformis]|uniref:YibE/F family protein n=1 Tax=Actinomadura rudentiformis TaxID=359158 RepID=UPI001CEF679F|nr:YibE/F family protein [Actinomadura rudentiformis]
MPKSPKSVRVAVLAVIVPVAVATLAAVLFLWPDQPEIAGSEPLKEINGTVVAITLKPCPQPEPGTEGAGTEGGGADGAVTDGRRAAPPDPRRCGDAKVKLTSGDQAGQEVVAPLPSDPGSQRYSVGDDVQVVHMTDAPDGIAYQLSDHQRSGPLWLIGAAFALAVIAFGRWRGVTALVGLAITFVLLLQFLIPAIMEGRPPLLVAIVCAAAIMLAVLYLTHGFSMPTSIAVIGTIASLSLTGLLATAAINLTHLGGLSDEDALNLDMAYQINGQGLLLASIIIGSLGVLDDVTVTQAVTVNELAHANPAYRFAQLYRAAARIGRAHIASVINTIILAYAGASLPLLLLLSVAQQPLGDVVTAPAIAQEIVRSVAGTLGLIAAVPITTALAALARTRAHAHADTDAHTDTDAHADGDTDEPDHDHDHDHEPTPGEDAKTVKSDSV